MATSKTSKAASKRAKAAGVAAVIGAAALADSAHPQTASDQVAVSTSDNVSSVKINPVGSLQLVLEKLR